MAYSDSPGSRCQACGDVLRYDGTTHHCQGGAYDATIGLAATLADAYAAVVAQRDAALARAESAERDWQDAEDRAAAAEAAAADLRARVVVLTAAAEAGRALADRLAVDHGGLDGCSECEALRIYDAVMRIHATAPAATAATAGEGVQS